MLKRYSQFIKEADEPEVQAPSDEEASTDSGKYSEVKDFIKEKIESTIEKSGGEYNTFVASYVKNPKDVKIEGLINDSDIYEFYLKFRNDIDEILNGVKYFDQVPSEVNAFGLYEYVIKGTEKSVEEIVKMLSE